MARAAVPGRAVARPLQQYLVRVYLFLGLTFELPFFFTFMFLMNHASSIWRQSLLIGLVVLFHFETRIALPRLPDRHGCGLPGRFLHGEGAYVLQREVLQQLPVHWFTIAALSVVKVGSKVLARRRGWPGWRPGSVRGARTAHAPRPAWRRTCAGMRRLLPQLAGQADTRPPLQEALSRIQFEVRHMQHMIDLFLMSASAVNRNLEAQPALLDADMVNAVLKRYPFTGRRSAGSVTVDVRADFQFAGQDELCVVILLNLLRNALKSHPAGRQGPRAHHRRRRPPRARLLFIDTGCGIATESPAADLRAFLFVSRA